MGGGQPPHTARPLFLAPLAPSVSLVSLESAPLSSRGSAPLFPWFARSTHPLQCELQPEERAVRRSSIK